MSIPCSGSPLVYSAQIAWLALTQPNAKKMIHSLVNQGKPNYDVHQFVAFGFPVLR